MPFNSWRPKFDRLRQQAEEERALQYPHGVHPWQQWNMPRVTIGAYEPERDVERIETPELYWMPEEMREDPEVKVLQFEKEAKAWMPWIAAGFAFPGATAMAGWRAVSTAPWWLKYPARVALSPLAGVEKSFGAFGELGKRGVAKLVTKVQEKVATYLQKLEAHRMARDMGLLKPQYEKLAKEITGKKSMADMSLPEADRFIAALMEQGGMREIQIPFTGSSGITKTKAKLVARELVEYMGKVPKPEAVITKATQRKGLIEATKGKVYGFTNRTYRIERILDKMDGYPSYPTTGKLTQTFWNPVNQASDTKLLKTYASLDDFRNFVKGNNISIKALLTKEMNISGVELTTGERMGVYLHSLNKDNLVHMKWGNGFSDDMIKKTIESLTPQERATADWIFKYWQTNTPRVAEAYKITTGKTMKTVENYTPIVVKGEDVAFEDMLTKEVTYRYTRRYPSAMIKKGFTKARTGTAKQPVELDVMALFVNRLPEVEHYVAFAPVLRDLQRIYADPALKAAFIKKESKATYQVVGQWLRDVAATNPLKTRSWSEKLLQQMRVNAVTAVLGFNITTAMKQLPSWMIGAAEIGNIPAMKGLFTYIANPKETGMLIKRLAPQIWKRSFEREIAEAKLMRGLEKRITERLSAREVFMFMTLAMDRLAVNSLWRGAFDSALRKGLPEKVSAEYATRAIRRTQPFFGVKDVPEFWRSNEFMRALTMFTNQLNQYWNYYRHDVWGRWAGRQLSSAEAVRKTIEGFIVPALMIGGITRSAPATDAKEFLTDIGSMGFATIPLMGHFLVAGFRGWQETQGLITTEVLDKLQQFAYRVNPERWDKVFDDIPKLAELGGQLGGFIAGVPVTQPTRTIKAMLEIAQGNTDDWLRLIWGNYVREELEGKTPLIPSP